MKRMMTAKNLFYGLTVGLLTTTCLLLENRSASAQSAACYAQFQGRMMFMFNGAFDSCARTIRGAANGAQFGAGTWGNLAVNTDINGNTYINAGNGWQYVGVVQPRASRRSSFGHNLERQVTDYYFNRQVPIQPRLLSPLR